MKKRKSITLDEDVSKIVHDEAKKQRLPFSTLVNKMLNECIMVLKYRKSEKK